MRTSMLERKKILLVIAAGVCALAAGLWIVGTKSSDKRAESAAAEAAKQTTKQPAQPADHASDTIVVTDQQAKQVRIEPASLHDFVSQRDAVGFVDFNQDTTVQALSTVTGKIRQVFVRAGDDVRKGQPLYSVDSPDLVQALSALISSAGVRAAATRTLERARKMLDIQATAQKDFDQAVADQQTAEGNYQAARDAVRIFGKSEAEMDKTIASRKPNGELIITSPIAGRVVSRNAAPGMLVQPGSLPSPITVADISTMWMIANAPEFDIPKIQLGQKVSIQITALPGEKFEGRVTSIGASIDPNTRRIPVRTEVQDATHQLRQQMLATYVIQTGEPIRSVAIPANGIVREGDGTMTLFVTTDGKTFTRRAVRTGQEQKGYIRILEGLSDGEKVATEGAIFLSNAILLQAR